MKRIALSLAVAVAVVAAAALQGRGDAAQGGERTSQPRVISVLGMTEIHGQGVLVDIWVFVPPGQDEGAVAEAALAAQGVQRADFGELGSAQFSMTGLVWDQFFDADPDNDYVVQHYNPAADPTGGNGETALTNTHATWTDVPTSSFAFHYGGQTSRCPSLVEECPGEQDWDGFNDVAWMVLSGETTLGVTWYGIFTDEADMALNTNFNWHAGSTSCTDQAGQYDAQTVFLHENGHVAGLDHSDVSEAVMYPYYGGARCQLHQDDIDGISSLYPGGGPSPTPTGTATPTPTQTATPTLTATATPVSDTDGDGCTDSEEETFGFDPLHWYDFYDVPVPASSDPTPNGPRNGAIDIGDVLAVLLYGGALDNGGPNGSGVDYDSVKGSCDWNADTTPDEEGRCYDRSPGAEPNPPYDAAPPNGGIDISDVLAVLAQAGLACSGPP